MTAVIAVAVLVVLAVALPFYVRRVGRRLAPMPPMPDLEPWQRALVADLTPEGDNYLRWPDGCDNPPCDIEDQWQCTAHLPSGKHHGPAVQGRHRGRQAAQGINYRLPLDDQPAAVIADIATDVKRRQS